MIHQDTKAISLATDNRHGYAMLLMVIGTIAISFHGPVQRHQVATIGFV